MPRDKSLSHIRVNRAIREEFLENGFEGASVRSIGVRAGMTSAGLYRHYADKKAMFESVVAPVVAEIKAWTERHKSRKYEMIDGSVDTEIMFGETYIDLIKDVIIPNKTDFKILMNCSSGTKYENFIHNYVLENQVEMLRAMDRLEQKGYKVRKISETDLHMLLSAYLTACFEPIIHDYEEERIEECLNLVQEFFMPGWYKIMGIT